MKHLWLQLGEEPDEITIDLDEWPDGTSLARVKQMCIAALADAGYPTDPSMVHVLEPLTVRVFKTRGGE